MARPLFLNDDDRPVYNAGFDMDELIDNLPAGLERAILDVLRFHVGREQAIGREQLLAELGRLGFRDAQDREVRACMSMQRKLGVKICSTGGIKGGYWLAASHEEVEEFCQRELDSRANDLHEQASAMRRSAEYEWGRYSPEKQISMF